VSLESPIRAQVLRGLALNRTPGYHYIGNFLDFSFDHVAERDLRLRMAVGPHCAQPDGSAHAAAVAVFADIALSSSVRAGHTPASRLATVQMNLQFTGTPATGCLHAHAALQGYVRNITSCQAATQVTVTAREHPVCFGYGTFMVLDPPKGVALYAMAHRQWSEGDITPLAETELTREERKVLTLADAALVETKGHAFFRRFLGYETHVIKGGAAGVLNNGPHVANRVGHLQGGITMALGIATAETALPPTWLLSAVTAWYISPGEGRVIKARSKVIHHGRLTAVVRTEIFGKNKRRVMEMITTHAHKSQPA